MESAFFLDVVVLECASIFKLFASEDKSLLIGWNALLILNLSLDVFDGIGRLNIEGDSFAGKSLNKDLHATTESKDEMKCRFLLDIVIL